MGSERFEVRVTADSHFGWLRTRLSVERTMMSWIRTAVVADRLRLCDRPVLRTLAANARSELCQLSSKRPQYLGLALIACGVLALVISIWQYRWTVRYMWGGSFAPIAGMNGGKEQCKRRSLRLQSSSSSSACSHFSPCCCVSCSARKPAETIRRLTRPTEIKGD